MLEPRKADIPALFLVLVVLPVVLYILLGKWSETTRRKGRRNLIVEEPFEETLRAEPMATASVAPLVVPPLIPLIRECARCHGPATTRCSRCKSVRYCSGKCQIIHWRQGHKDECRPLDYIDSSSLDGASATMDFSHDHYTEFHGCSSQLPMQEEIHTIKPNAISDDVSLTCSATLGAAELSRPERRVSERRVSRKKNKEMLDVKNKAATISSDANLRSTSTISNESNSRHKLRGNGSTKSEDSYPDMHHMNRSVISDGYSDQMYGLESPLGVCSQNGDPLSNGKRAMDEVGVGIEYIAPAREVSRFSKEVSRNSSSLHMQSSNVSNGAANVESFGHPKSAKSATRAGREQVPPTKLRKANGSDESGVGTSTSAHENDGATSSGLRKMTGLKKLSKMFKQDAGIDIHSLKKVKVLFPFEVFSRFFEHQVFDLSPRGLQNCGNSCYANAVLQCLTCTKPLVVYLLSRMHSRACCRNNWCLMCELEQHVMMLKEAGGPLSPSRILSHMRGINCQIGDGSQEDAHEFLRLLVASMQSICLEEVGGENQVHPILQETTFVLQTFGGRLRSLVVCLRCHHESERYENIMDLTLEIYGWVESLEDALTQFTTPEDLDGENMYRCGRCSSYVRARKQLSIDEAPNILTIVLKRFQEGSYGKINKCITFPEMLDMVPYMTGTNDVPPLYMLYGVVVHVDTLNASFSGHYVSYVKDLKGNWYRIDDSVVQPVPTSQVMSEGAYILFYMRSFPRPPRACLRKATKNQPPTKTSNSCGQNAQRTSRFTQATETYTEPSIMEFSDATASDWSLFTSSDDASFTSESTRDSFSLTDHSDMCHVDPFTSMFSHSHPSHRTVSCRMFSGSQPTTQYISEETGYILDSENFVNYETNSSDCFVTSFNDFHL
ncbi:ubiquitin carboxyl-terminal hydrolase 15 isoform X2 [Silene latifolia]|uniref:ubiquitin carboxyl-terminal hydrolase 15 isoform X2 n=1 Tax=Silene latifolia TaxID=37657 RepID=UPI003D780C63